MGGGGGSWHSSGSSEKFKQASRVTDSVSYDTATNSLIMKALSDINQTDVESINRHKEEIFGKLDKLFEEIIKLDNGGSYSKHTYVSGLSDIDILVNLGTYTDSSISDKDDPIAVLKLIESALKERFPKTEIKRGKMAVTLKFSDGVEIQVLPAFKYFLGYKLPDPTGKGWVTSQPKEFSNDLTKVNKSLGSKLVPLIKLAKVICNNNAIGVSSYHLENLAVDTFRNYTGSTNYIEMLKYFFNQSKSKILKKMPDPSGQSDNIDSYIKSNEQRKSMAKAFKNIEESIIRANTQNDVKFWGKSLQINAED